MKNNLTDKLVAAFLLFTVAMVILFSTGVTFMQDDQFINPATMLRLDMVLQDNIKPDAAAYTQTKLNNAIHNNTGSNITIDPVHANESSIINVPVEPFIKPGISLHPGDTNIVIKDNTITKTYTDENGKEKEMKMVVRKGEVVELYINGDEIPAEEFTSYKDQVDQTLDQVRIISQDLHVAREDLEIIEMDNLHQEVEEELRQFKEEYLEEITEQMENLRIEIPEIQINMDSLQVKNLECMEALREINLKIRQEMEQVMENVREVHEEIVIPDIEVIHEQLEKAVKAIDMEKIRIEMEHSMQEAIEMKELEMQKIELQLQEALRDLEEIDLSEMEKNMQEFITDMESGVQDFEREKRKMDKMIEEIEKLELEEEK